MKRPVPVEDVRKAAHDFNNLLTAIIGTTDAILERSAIDLETRADITHIREGAHRGTMLVRRLGGKTHDPSASEGLTSINESIRATYRLLDHSLGAQITLTLNLEESGGQVMIDPAQLDRALLNLIANARHAMPNGGIVTLSTARRAVTVAELRIPDTIMPGNYVVIAVADTGTGVHHKQISRIFETRFSSRHRTGGSGLGLSSTHDIVHQSNGFLSVESVEGHGTRFEIHLPCVAGAPPPVAVLAAAADEGRTVLLVEDDQFLRSVLTRTLQRAGWKVLSVASAEEALEAPSDHRYDLMISDLTLPGMDGAALARLVTARQPGLPVILTSGYQRAAMDDETKIANITFLTKPFSQTELLEAITRALEITTAGP